MLSHDVGVPLLHSTARCVRQMPVHRCTSLLRCSPVSDTALYMTVTCIHNQPAIRVLWSVCAPHLHTPGFVLTIGPSCTAHTTSYHVHLVCIPLFSARKTVLYCHPTSVFSKYPYSRVWADDSSFFLCKYGVLLWSSSVNTSIPCTQTLAILSSDVCLFKIPVLKCVAGR